MVSIDVRFWTGPNGVFSGEALMVRWVDGIDGGMETIADVVAYVCYNRPPLAY